MDMKTPKKSNLDNSALEFGTPINFTKELKQVLYERNLLTAKSRRKVCSLLDKQEETSASFDKRNDFRLQAIQEILDSEKNYLSQLETLMTYFVTPLKEQAIINDSSHTSLFGQVEMIYNLNGEFLKELEENLENVGKAFLKMAPFFKLYSVYAFDYKNALLILQDLSVKNPVFRKFLEVNESRPEVYTKLNSLMIVPIQRIPRYKLLLEQVLLYTSPSDPDHKILKDSVKQIESTCTHINSVVEEQEVTQMILNVQNSLVNRLPNIVKPGRKVIKEDVLFKVTRNGAQVKRYCVLMSDIFMYCKIVKERSSKSILLENSLECCCIFPLKKCKVFELWPGNFKITCQGDGIILCTEDQRLGQSWVSILKEAIDIHIQCRKTLRKESSKRTPMRKKDVKHFEPDSIISPQKRKYDYESVFRNKNSNDSDEDEKTSKCLKISNTQKFFKPFPMKLKTATVAPFRHFGPPNQNAPKTNIPKENSQKTKKTKTPSPTFAPPTIRPPANTKLNRMSSTRSEDSTYGFANRYSDSKSYFRTTNVDSTIPTVLTREDLFTNGITNEGFKGNTTVTTSEGFKDITNGITNKGFRDIAGGNRGFKDASGGITNEGFNSTIFPTNKIYPPTIEEENQENMEEMEEPAPRKRVKFDVGSYAQKPKPYKFEVQPMTQKTSLRQKIVDFFASFF